MSKNFLFIATLVFFLSISLFSSAQETQTPDSLKACLHNASTYLEKADIELKICNYYLGVFPDSVERHANNAIKIYNSHKMFEKTAEATLILAQSYKFQGYFDQAIYCVKGLLEGIKEEKNELLLGKCYHFIGELCRSTTLYESAILYLKNSLKIAVDLHDKQLKANCYDRLAAVYFEKNNYWQSICYADSALEISRRNHYFGITVSSLDILGAVHTSLGQYDEALDVQIDAVDICLKHDQLETILPNIYRNIGRTYYRQHDLKNALEYTTISYNMADKSKIWVYMDISAGLLSKIYAAMENYEQAFKYSEISKDITNSIREKEIAYKISELNARYENAKKEKLIADQNNELYQNQIQMLKDKTRLHVLLTGSFVMIALIVILIVFYLHKRRDHKRIKLQNQQIVEKNIEMEKLTEEITLQTHELKKTNEELLKLTTFKVFMTNMMVHDLKNPLNSIIGFSEVHPESTHFAYINHAAKGMLQLVSNMLDIQKYEKSEMQIHKQYQQVGPVLNRAVEELKVALEMRELKIDVQTEPYIEAFFDSEIIIRVVINLLTNAVKYSVKKSTITLYALKETKNDRNFVKISVHNQGEVIPNDKLDQIFDEFTDFNSRKLGVSYSTGLGLSFCRIAVKAHNGEMGVESVESTGTTFWFTLEA